MTSRKRQRKLNLDRMRRANRPQRSEVYVTGVGFADAAYLARHLPKIYPVLIPPWDDRRTRQRMCSLPDAGIRAGTV